MAIVKTQILLRNDSKANWEQYNPVLAAGEVGVEFDPSKPSAAGQSSERKIKIGDGFTPWNDLDYFGGDVPPALEERLEDLEEAVGDSSSGLIKDVADLGLAVGTLTSDVSDLGIEVDGLEHDLGLTNAALATLTTEVDNLGDDVTDLQTVIGNQSSGLVKDVTDLGDAVDTLESVVGDSNSGLVKDVADNSTAIASLTARVATAEGNITRIDGEIDDIQDDIALLQSFLRFEGTAYADETGGVITLYEDAEKTQVINPASCKGAVYQVDDKEYASNGSAWVELGFNIDLSNLATKAEVEGIEIAGVTLGADRIITANELKPALDIDDLETDVAGLTARVTAAEGDIDVLQATVSDLDSTINAPVTGLVDVVDGLEQKVSDIEDQLDPSAEGSLAKQVSDNTGNIAAISATVDAVSATVDVIAATLNGITPTIATLAQTYVPLTRTVAGFTLTDDITVQQLANALGVGGSLIGDVDTDYFALATLPGHTDSYKLTLASNITNTIILNGGNAQG